MTTLVPSRCSSSGVSEAFKADKSSKKINLGVGAYVSTVTSVVLPDRNPNRLPRRTTSLSIARWQRQALRPPFGARGREASLQRIFGQGVPPHHRVGRLYQAERRVGLRQRQQAHQGRKGCRRAVYLGNRCPPNRNRFPRESGVTSSSEDLCSVESSCFQARFYPHAKAIYLPSPSWGNHTPIAKDSGLEVKQYTYFDKETVGLNFEGMKKDIQVGKLIVVADKQVEQSADRSVDVRLPFCRTLPTTRSSSCMRKYSVLQVAVHERLLTLDRWIIVARTTLPVLTPLTSNGRSSATSSRRRVTSPSSTW
jgi:hypothetical protein